MGRFCYSLLAIRYSLLAIRYLVLSSKTSSVTAAKSASAAGPPSAKSASLASLAHGLGFIDGNAPFSDLLAVHGFNRFHGLFIVGHFHESESPAPAGVTVGNDFG